MSCARWAGRSTHTLAHTHSYRCMHAHTQTLSFASSLKGPSQQRGVDTHTLLVQQAAPCAVNISMVTRDPLNNPPLPVPPPPPPPATRPGTDSRFEVETDWNRVGLRHDWSVCVGREERTVNTRMSCHIGAGLGFDFCHLPEAISDNQTRFSLAGNRTVFICLG